MTYPNKENDFLSFPVILIRKLLSLPDILEQLCYSSPLFIPNYFLSSNKQPLPGERLNIIFSGDHSLLFFLTTLTILWLDSVPILSCFGNRQFPALRNCYLIERENLSYFADILKK